MSNSSCSVERDSSFKELAFSSGNRTWFAKTVRGCTLGGCVGSPYPLKCDGVVSYFPSEFKYRAIGIFEGLRFNALNLRMILLHYYLFVKDRNPRVCTNEETVVDLVPRIGDLLVWLNTYTDIAPIDVCVKMLSWEDDPGTPLVEIYFHGCYIYPSPEVVETDPVRCREMDWVTFYQTRLECIDLVLVYLLLYCSEYRTGLERAQDCWANMTLNNYDSYSYRTDNLFCGRDDVLDFERFYPYNISPHGETDVDNVNSFWGYIVSEGLGHLRSEFEEQKWYQTLLDVHPLLPRWLFANWNFSLVTVFNAIEDAQPLLNICEGRIQRYEDWLLEGSNGKEEPPHLQFETLSTQESRDGFRHLLSGMVARDLPIYPAIRLLESTAGPTFERSGVVGVEASMFRYDSGEPASYDMGKDPPES